VVIDKDPGQRCQTQPAAIPSRNPFNCTNNLLQITIFSQHMQQQLHQQRPAVLLPSGSLYLRQAFSQKERRCEGYFLLESKQMSDGEINLNSQKYIHFKI
jgi:hypothetical protein